MNKIIIIILLFCIKANAQICGKVMFKETSNIDVFYQTISTTKFNKDSCFTKYMPYKKAKVFLEKKDEKLESGQVIDIEDVASEETRSILNTPKETFFTYPKKKEVILIKEDKFNWKWKIINETKKIGGFNCHKATIHFRGRKYIAWFTKEIPVSFGPLKFKGLPGLILEIYDSKNLWNMRAIKVEVNNDKNCNFNFNHNTEKAISIKKYIEKRNQEVIESIKKSIAQLPKGSRAGLIDFTKCLFCENSKKQLEIFK